MTYRSDFGIGLNRCRLEAIKMRKTVCWITSLQFRHESGVLFNHSFLGEKERFASYIDALCELYGVDHPYANSHVLYVTMLRDRLEPLYDRWINIMVGERTYINKKGYEERTYTLAPLPCFFEAEQRLC
jgi:hypothetical protein